MQKVLILGGTRFFGKKLVEQLISEQVDVTILTRGETSDSFGSNVKRLQANRKDPVAMRHILGTSTFDVVYDNICYTPQDAENAVKLFAGRTGTYIVTSSLSVYPCGDPRKQETDYDPYVHPIPDPYPADIDYGEGKRLVEAVLLQKAAFPVTAVRFPIVLGPDDYTRRLHFHVEHVQQGLPLGIPNPDASISFIRADEAAAFLTWLGRSSLVGPVNACSMGEITPGQMVALIEQATGKQAIVQSETEEAHMSPFGVPQHWYMDTTKAESAGYSFEALDDWLPNLIRGLVG